MSHHRRHQDSIVLLAIEPVIRCRDATSSMTMMSIGVRKLSVMPNCASTVWGMIIQPKIVHLGSHVVIAELDIIPCSTTELHRRPLSQFRLPRRRRQGPTCKLAHYVSTVNSHDHG